MTDTGKLEIEWVTHHLMNCEQKNTQWLAATGSRASSNQLEHLAANESTSLAVLERIAEHPNTPPVILKKLAAHPNPDVRSAVLDNTHVSSAIILQLSDDDSPDVRFRMAENHHISTGILERLSDDDNPYVAHRARKTLERLQLPARSTTSNHDETNPQSHQIADLDDSKILQVLVIEDNPADVRLLQKLLVEGPFKLAQVERLTTALKHLQENAVDVVLLDLSLPDSQGIDTFYQLHCQIPHIPIVVLTGLEDESIGNEAVQSGAQDYLVKGQVTPGLLGRSIKYAVDRHQAQARIKQLNEILEQRVLQLAAINQELDKLSQSLAISCEQAMHAKDTPVPTLMRSPSASSTPATRNDE